MKTHNQNNASLNGALYQAANPPSTSIKAALRSKKGNKRGIYVRVTIGRQSEYYPTGYYIEPAKFDCKSGLVKGNELNREEINSYVRYLSNDLDEVLSGLKRSDDMLSLENFKRHKAKLAKRDMRFDEYFANALAEKKATLEPATVELYGRLHTKLKEFAPNITVRSIDKNFVREWEQWLKHEKGLCQNTTNRYLQTLRTFLLKAVEDELIEATPFAKIRISHVQGKRDFLAQAELDALMQVKIPQANIGEARARELFVFCCLTGIRYSDLVNLKWTHVRQLTKDLHFNMQKTKLSVTIPLLDEALDIINRQEKNSEYIFKRISNQKLNEHLHALEKRAGIQKSLTVHVARHTFATLSLERGVPIEVVSKVLGHTDLKTTMVYAKITHHTMQKEMQKLRGLVNPTKVKVECPDMAAILLQMQGLMQKMEEAQGR